jgi:drug/metabolite transporter (DMT)-like permease
MRWTLWIAFAVLCLLSGTSWVIPREMSGELPPLEQQAVLFGVIGLTALVFAGRRVWSRNRGLRYARLSAAAVGFFGVPMVVVEYARGSVPAISRSALFALVPVVVVVVMAVASGESAEREERGARLFLMPALAGLGGLLFLLPLAFSNSARGWMMLTVVCAAVILVGLASVWIYRLLRGVSFVDAIAVVGVANAVFLLGWSAVREAFVWRGDGLASVVSISSLADVTEVLLITWLLREMSPVRFAARYLVIPLLTVLESYVVMRPEWTVRMGVGTALLAAGGGMMLFLKAGEEETVLSLR